VIGVPVRRYHHVLLALGVSLLCISSTTFGRTTRSYAGQEIPKRICLPSGGIISGSDSLYLNERPLVRGIDYAFDRVSRCFILDNLIVGGSDTLRVSFV